MFEDFKDLIALLNKHKVKYLVVGGYAVSAHAQPRATRDLDILILPAPRNAAAIFRALREFGAPLRTRLMPDSEPIAPTRPLAPKDFENPGTWFTMGVSPVAVDILSGIPGVTFNAAWKNRITQVIDRRRNLSAYFISRDDLIVAKLASGRPRDLADVAELRKAKAAAERQARRAPIKPATPRARRRPRKIMD